MSKKPTYEQLMGQIAEAAVGYQRAETKRNALRRELNGLYKTYFAAYGHPYPGEPRKRIDPDDERFMGVLSFTDAAFQRWLDSRELTTKLKRKLRGLVERLERAQ
ncbi:hypothetical protein RDI61_16570 [Pseudomonas plecoglossicida]|uniref:hypothetical protein n=1 Tax=Pseudomonas putida group TaxID=136845 RepID=UPI000305C649|nr:MULTISPECIES: hypothetical protein [Pseudomonas putida group]ANC82984.1 hypothetical protein KKK_19050 [Pseudomonas putida B6-2]KGK24332.1 hypothetical protein GT93_05510 [Pseudomonas plecoglossicida]MDM9598609.1 hypothetical protein [Pseudomonas shirazica]MDO2412037.1 hypothetical protein [Pseudomonas shirazica]MDQ7965639.1 hypothetical protein [Pseudomonas plecoglossicida]